MNYTVKKIKATLIFTIVLVDIFLFINVKNACGEGSNFSSLYILIVQCFIIALIIEPIYVYWTIRAMTKRGTDQYSGDNLWVITYFVIVVLILFSFGMLYEGIRGTTTIAGSDYCNSARWMQSEPVDDSNNILQFNRGNK